MGFHSKARVTKSRSIARVVAPPAQQIFSPSAPATLTLTGQTPPDFLAAWRPSASATLTLTGQTPSVKTTWDPTLLGAALVAWYDASQIVGLNDGDAVGTWSDLSGNGHHLTESTFKPTYKTAIQNGLAVVRFNGTDNRLAVSYTLNQPHTRFVAFVQREASPADTVLDGGAGDNAGRLGSNIIAGNNNGQAYSGTTGINSLVALTNGSAFCLGAVFNNTSSVIRVGNTEVTGTVGTNNPGGMKVARSGGGVQFAQIDVCEIIETNTAMSVDDRLSVATYFHNKWAT